ncbi:ankyrin [Coprinellus micaceus]|uniref:Ankyrin n=1 Tax=Coprinellus micaceus TaxID=71717 RepID=A0A4Y7SE84_COPMI|nr:ankyrin [Coprinellus micaceus]
MMDRTALEVVCITGHWDILHILVENGAGVNALFKDGRTALEVAVYERGCKHVHIPVGLGASINTPLKDGQTALEVATRASDWEGVRILVGLGAGINATFKDGQRVLEVATRASDREGIRILVGLGADVNSANKAGETALEVVTCAPDLECLRTLLELGANINTIFSDGKTALEVVSVAQDWDLLCFLVESGVDVNAMFTGMLNLCLSPQRPVLTSNIIIWGSDGSTALEAVSSPHNWDVLCTQRGIDVNPVLADGKTVLEVAICTQDWEGTHVLGKLGAKVSPTFKDTFGQAALMAAVDARDKKAVCALAVSGCVRIEDGQIELDVAIDAENWERVRFLVVLKANNGIAFRDGSESMVLKFAAEKGQWDLIPEIVDAGANVNMPVNGFRDTVLHLACESECRPAVIEQLLQKGADPNAKGLRGRTALHRACWSGREDCVPLLLAHGADPHLQDNGGDTPLHDACRHGHGKCVELLLKHQAKPADPNAKKWADTTSPGIRE